MRDRTVSPLWAVVVVGVVCPLLALSCRATQPDAGGAEVPGAPAPHAGIRFQTDLAPVSALAVSQSYLWIGSERGLRRLRLSDNQVDWFATTEGLAGHAIKALAPGADGGVWIATEVGLVRGSAKGNDISFQALAALPDVSRIVPTRSEQGVWLGTEHGLFFLDTGASTPVVQGKNALAKSAITFLQLDADGKSVWAGGRGHGLAHFDGRKVVAEFGPTAPIPLDFVDVVGVAAFANGTPFALGRAKDGGTRLVVLRKEAPQMLVSESSWPVLGMVATDAGPLVLAGRANAPTVMTLGIVERGEPAGSGAIRLVPAPKSLDGIRAAARPDPRGLPRDVTTWIVAGDELFVGTRAMGVARVADVPAAAAPAPAVFLPSGELAWKGSALSVACLDRERCVVSTGAGPGWIWDGSSDAFRPVPPEALGSALMSLSGDGDGAVYFLAADGPKGIKVARLSADGGRWDPLLTVQTQTEGAPVVAYATVSPEGNLWLALRDKAASGEQLGVGVIEVRLPSGQYVHHRAARKGEPLRPNSIPLVGDVRAVRFQAETAASPGAIWFCTSLGVARWAGGKLSRWSENDGLASDSCDDLVIESNGTVWAATHDGPARFDGKAWIPFDGAPVQSGGPRRWPRAGRADDERDDDLAAARSLIRVGGTLWAATPKGVWPLMGPGTVFDRRTGLIDDDVVDLTLDRFGRLWVLGHLGLTVTDAFPSR